MSNEGWQPIEKAPRDGTRIILGYENPLYTGIWAVFGRWEVEKYSKHPRPHFTHDLADLVGRNRTRVEQPKWWMPQPVIPEEKE